MTSILNENYNKLIFLGNKRSYNADIQCKSQNENKTENLKYININWLKKNNKNEIYNLLEINSDLKQQENLLNNLENDERNICKGNETLNKNVINENINLDEEELFGDIKKVIRYKKAVYVNKSILKEKKVKKTKRKGGGNTKRSSKYRGVSQNGIGWQALMMFKNKKPYLGTYYSEELAARIYDIASIKKNGIKSKTNYLYIREQIKRILITDIDFKDQNISKIISELIK